MGRLFTGRAFALAAAGFLSCAAPAWAADHRDAPKITFSSAVDINDVYMFRAPGDASKLVMVMTTHPLGEPDFATTYPYQPDALYRFFFSTRVQEAKPTAQIDFVFSKPSSSGQTFSASFPGNVRVDGTVTPANGTTATPNAPIINNGPAGSGIRIFAGPREDPFYFDLVGFNRVVGRVGGFRGIDSFAGLNTNAIVVEFPISLVAGSARTLSAWAVTYLNRNERSGEGGDDRRRGQNRGKLEQADRMGNPAVNTVFIPSPLKDAFNAAEPKDDARDFAPVILNTLTSLGTNATNIGILAAVAVPDTLKFDVTLPDGFPNGRRLPDDVIQTLLSLVFGAPNATTGVDDGVAANDKAFLSVFPYLAPPFQPTIP